MLSTVDGVTSAMGAASLNGQPNAMLPPQGGLTTSFDDRAAAAQAAANGGGIPAPAAPAGFQPRALPAGVPEGPRPQEAARPKVRVRVRVRVRVS